MKKWIQLWRTFYLSWLKCAADYDMIVVNFEDLLGEPLAQIETLARFLGTEIPKKHLSCILDNLTGKYKRVSHGGRSVYQGLQFDQTIVNESIDAVRQEIFHCLSWQTCSLTSCTI